MKNMIKIFSVVLVIAIAVIAFNCGGKTESTETTTDSTAVQVDTTSTVSGGAGDGSVGEVPANNIK